MSARARISLVLCLVCAGCGLDDASPGVRVAPAESVPADAGSSDRDFTDAGPAVAGAPAAGAAGADAAGDPDAGLADSGQQRLPMPASVAVVGDSLTLSAADEIEAALSELGLDVLTVDAVESRRMVHGGRDLPPGSDAIDSILRIVRPELWVIALGTNDVGAQSGSDAFRDDMRSVLALVPRDAPVVWVDLWIRDRDGAVVDANRTLRSVLAQRAGPNAVVDWHAHGDEPGIVTGDGIHLTDAGQLLFAQSIADTVASMFAL